MYPKFKCRISIVKSHPPPQTLNPPDLKIKMNKTSEDCQEPADFCTMGLRQRYDFYKDPKTGLSTGMTVEMNSVMCSFVVVGTSADW